MRSLIVLTLCATFLAGCGKPDDSRRLAHDEVLLRISATGDAETRPDLATFSAGVSSLGPTSEAATTANNLKMNRVMTAIESLGVKRDDTQTQNLSVNRIDYGRNRGQFEANNVVSVKVRKIDSAGAVIGAATGAGANIVSGPILTVDDREKANLSAYAAAFRAARARADVYAKAAGLKVARVLSITDGSAMGEPIESDAATGYERMAPPPVVQTSAPPIRAGLNASTAQVRVDFALAP